MLNQKGTLAVLLLLAAAVGTRSVRVPHLKMNVAAADLFVFCSLGALAPVAAPLVALASVIGTHLGPGRRSFSIRTAFNLGVVPLSAAAAAGTFLAVGGAITSPHFLALPLLAAGATYALVNLGIAALAVHLETGRSWTGIFGDSVSWVLVASLSSALLGLGLLSVREATGPLGLAIGVLPATPFAAYFRSRHAPVEKRDEIFDRLHHDREEANRGATTSASTG